MSRVVLVLGMHRSGTSSLTGTLQEAGLHLGDVVNSGGRNVKGNRENIPIILLHEQVLRHSGGSWDAPPEHVHWFAPQKLLRDRIIAGYADAPLWGFKDPRTLLTLDGWLEVLDDVRFVATFRQPMNVVRSLIARNGGPEDKWIDVWIAYNERLLALHRRYEFPLISFDLPQERYRRALIPIIESIGLKPPATFSFFEPEHRHHVESPKEIPERARPTYERLLDIAVQA